MKIIFTIFNIRIIILPRYYMIRLWRSGRIKPLSRNFFPAMNAKGSINASVSFFLSRRIVETWNNLITKKGKNGETRVNHNACLILSSLLFLPFLEKWLFRTTVSDNGADNGLTSINQVQPGVIGRECKKKIEGVWECKSGWGTLLRGKERANSSWPIRETTSKRLFKIKKRKKKKEVYSVVITI